MNLFSTHRFFEETAAPILGFFTCWLIERATRDRVSDLYFLARDGWFFFHAARRLCLARALPIRCHYLYVSRKTLSDFTPQNKHLTLYLTQAGLLKKTRAAIVDSGWMGSIQPALNRRLLEAGRTAPVFGYYFGLYQVNHRTPFLSKGRTAYFSPQTHYWRKVFFSPAVFETIFSAPHGTTISYGEASGRAFPICVPANIQTKAFIRTGADILFVNGAIDKWLSSPLSVRAIFRICIRLMAFPSHGTADFLGNLSFSDNNQNETALAPILSKSKRNSGRFFPSLFHFFRKRSSIPTSWYAGSAVRSYPIPLFALLSHFLWQMVRQFPIVQRIIQKRRCHLCAFFPHGINMRS